MTYREMSRILINEKRVDKRRCVLKKGSSLYKIDEFYVNYFYISKKRTNSKSKMAQNKFTKTSMRNCQKMTLTRKAKIQKRREQVERRKRRVINSNTE